MRSVKLNARFSVRALLVLGLLAPALRSLAEFRHMYRPQPLCYRATPAKPLRRHKRWRQWQRLAIWARFSLPEALGPVSRRQRDDQ